MKIVSGGVRAEPGSIARRDFPPLGQAEYVVGGRIVETGEGY